MQLLVLCLECRGDRFKCRSRCRTLDENGVGRAGCSYMGPLHTERHGAAVE